MSVVVILSDEKDHERAENTLRAVRTTGQWRGALVWIAINFNPNKEFVARWNIQVLHRNPYNMSWLWELRQKYPFQNWDGRETKKLVQFSKWHVFDFYFKKYKSLLFLDAGTHISHPIGQIFTIPHKNLFIAQDDRFPFDNKEKNFRKQWDEDSMPEIFNSLQEYCEKELGENVLDEKGYFLNCMWLMDTSLIDRNTQLSLIGLLRKFPIAKTNEMAVMNLHFYKNWRPLPEKINDLIVFDWTERFGNLTENYILLKYPHFPQRK